MTFIGPDHPALAAATYAAQLAAAATAVLLAGKLPAHRPIARAFVLLVLLSVIRAVCVFAVLRPARAAMVDPTAPFTSAGALVAVYIDGAGFLAEVLIVAGAMIAAYLETPRRALVALAAAWALASVVLAALYPSPLVRGEGLQRVYLAAELATVAIGVACVFAFAARRLSPRAPHAIALFMLAAEVAAIGTGPWRSSIFSEWDAQRVILLVSYLFTAGIQGVLWRFFAGSSE